jgi:hypothetical protein
VKYAFLILGLIFLLPLASPVRHLEAFEEEQLDQFRMAATFDAPAINNDGNTERPQDLSSVISVLSRHVEEQENLYLRKRMISGDALRPREAPPGELRAMLDQRTGNDVIEEMRRLGNPARDVDSSLPSTLTKPPPVDEPESRRRLVDLANRLEALAQQVEKQSALLRQRLDAVKTDQDRLATREELKSGLAQIQDGISDDLTKLRDAIGQRPTREQLDQKLDALAGQNTKLAAQIETARRLLSDQVGGQSDVVRESEDIVAGKLAVIQKQLAGALGDSRRIADLVDQRSDRPSALISLTVVEAMPEATAENAGADAACRRICTDLSGKLKVRYVPLALQTAKGSGDAGTSASMESRRLACSVDIKRRPGCKPGEECSEAIVQRSVTVTCIRDE